MSTTRPQPATPPPGLRVGDYRLLAKIGEGGMGVVHLAEGADGRRVALKVLRPHIIGDDEARERLGREVASLRRVRSPRVAEVIDADPWGATPFVATRYVPGLSLHEHVREEGVIGGDDLRHLASAMAEAVLAVHSVGVLHRDIKPSNVLLEGRSPVLIDFGLARLADDPRLTVTGWLLGTPGYLAPEILYGEDATTASDVHSWAATLVYAATGRPPFGRGPAMAVMDRVRRGEHDLSGVPGDLLPLVEAALAADPDARPTLPTLLADLRPRRRWSRSRAGDMTMPMALATRRHDDDATELIDARDHDRRDTAATAATSATPLGATDTVPPTTPLTRVVPADPPVDPAPATGPTATTPLTRPAPATRPFGSVHEPARAPYMQPAPPASRHGTTPAPVPAEAPRRSPAPSAKAARGLLLGGMFALAVIVFGMAPYVAFAGLSVAVLATRTWSWTTESSRERVWRRGRRRWYDGPLAVASAPWYLLVAAGGTLVLLLWAAALTFVVGVGMLVFRAPVVPGLLVMGAVLAASVWWGPGGRRVRAPTRALLRGLTRVPWLGALVVAALAVAVVAAAMVLAQQGVSWTPQPGPPWRGGTLLGELAGLL